MGASYCTVYGGAGVSVTNADNTNMAYVVNKASADALLEFYHLTWGCAAAPANNMGSYEGIYVTDENATPGGTARTCVPINKAINRTAHANSVELPTGAPTTTGDLVLCRAQQLQVAFIQLVFQPRNRIITPASEDTGLLIRANAPSTAFNVIGEFYHEET